MSNSGIISDDQHCPLGKQILVELFDCDPGCLDGIENVKRALADVADSIGVDVIKSAFHQFSPHGISGVLLIRESHITIHTWPEYRYAAVDVFTCGETIFLESVEAELRQRFRAEQSACQIVLRGHTRPGQAAIACG